MLDPQLAAGHAYRGAIRSLRNLDWTAADADFRRALELDPGDPILQRRYATYLYRMGRLDEAVATAHKANELDPLSFEAWNSLGFYENARGNIEDARRALNRSIALSPHNPYANFNLGCNSLMQGNAVQALEEFRKVPDGHFLRAAGLAIAHHVLGNTVEARAVDLQVQPAALAYIEIDRESTMERAEFAAELEKRGLSLQQFEPIDLGQNRRAYAVECTALV